jgi:hypothetical protein
MGFIFLLGLVLSDAIRNDKQKEFEAENEAQHPLAGEGGTKTIASGSAIVKGLASANPIRRYFSKLKN